MVDIPEQAVEAAHEIADQLDERVKLKYSSPDGKECQIVPLELIYHASKAIRALTAAAPYMQDAAREQALEEAARIAERHEGEPCGPAIAWTEEQRQFYASGQQDASSSIAAAIRALKSQPAQTGWLPIKEEPDNTKGPFLVTNNPKALNAFDRPSHVWCVSGIYTDDDGSFCAFEGNQKIHGLTMFMPVVAPQPGGGDE